MFTHFKASTSAVCPSGRMHRRTFPDLERGGGGGVSADSKSLVVKHKFSLGQITKKQTTKKTAKNNKIELCQEVQRGAECSTD